VADLDGTAGAEARIETSTDASGNPTVRVSGDLDMSNAETLKATIASVTASGPECLILDFSALRFMDSAGIAVLVDAANQVPTVRLRDPTPAVRRVVEITGLTAMIAMEP
jgi:anti-sigma B factor antagonist